MHTHQALYTADPRSNPDARPIRIVERIDDLCVEIGSAGSWGTGGMATKIQVRICYGDMRAMISTVLLVFYLNHHACSPLTMAIF